MIEVLFSKGEAEALKAAKSTTAGSILGAGPSKKCSNGPTAVLSAGKKKPPVTEFSGWVQGTAEEVIYLGFMLDIGDIKEAADSQYRREFLYSLYARNRKTTVEIEKELNEKTDSCIKEITKLKKYLEKGESLRIWYSDAPYSRCGFYNLCTMLLNYKNEIHTIKLPEYRICKNSIVTHQNWGEIAAEEFAVFLPLEQILSKEEIRMYAFSWNRLVEDNSPLRAMVNGRLVGVAEDFYDFAIWKMLTKDPVKEARLIGNIIGVYQISVSDQWYAARIAHFIKQGKIKVAEDAENEYARMICLA